MNNDHKQLSDALTDAAINFLTPLRMADGFYEDKYDNLCQAIRNINEAYVDSDLLPKSVVNIFVDITPAMDGCLSLYNDEERERILRANATLVDLINEGL